MNTKRVTAMRHRRFALKRSEKEKEEMVIEAAAYAAAMATADAIRNYEEEDNKSSYRFYLYESRHGVTDRETCLKNKVKYSIVTLLSTLGMKWKGVWLYIILDARVRKVVSLALRIKLTKGGNFYISHFELMRKLIDLLCSRSQRCP